MSVLKSLTGSYGKYITEKRSQEGQSICFFNWIGERDGFWFKKFIENRNILNHKKETISFFSLFGDKLPIYINRSKIKIFFSGENVHRNEGGFSFQKYEDYALNSKIDLALGFDYGDSERYLRFPLWILYFIKPHFTPSEITTFCHKLSIHTFPPKVISNFCSLISGHDPNGIREEIHNSLLPIDAISCAGQFLNNTNELKEKYNDDKLYYLEQFKFNICPENSSSPGYVTEKIFQAIHSGAIPVYWGSDNNPESDILNKAAIIFWNMNGDNTAAINLIKELHENEKLYAEFYRQPRLLPHADEVIVEMLDKLERKLRILIKNL